MGRRREIAPPKRGEVVVVDFDPTIGAEIRKRRPALVIQNDIDPPEGGLTRPSAVLLNEIRSVDKKRVVLRLGRLKPETMTRVDRALQISLGLVKL